MRQLLQTGFHRQKALGIVFYEKKLFWNDQLSLKSILYPGILCSEQSLDTALLILPAVANLRTDKTLIINYRSLVAMPVFLKKKLYKKKKI